jgi:hypothetical protein
MHILFLHRWMDTAQGPKIRNRNVSADRLQEYYTENFNTKMPKLGCNLKLWRLKSHLHCKQKFGSYLTENRLRHNYKVQKS